MLGCLSPCVVVCTLRLTWPFLWSCGWSILYVSSALLLHDSLHSLFTPVCLSVTRQGALHVLKGIPQLVIPSSQGWGGGGGGVRLFHLDSTRFFFAPFCLLLFCFCTICLWSWRSKGGDTYASGNPVTGTATWLSSSCTFSDGRRIQAYLRMKLPLFSKSCRSVLNNDSKLTIRRVK